MATVQFEEVAIRGTRHWKDSDGKRHQESKKFWQTINPYNLNGHHEPKTRREITEELMAERKTWLEESHVG